MVFGLHLNPRLRDWHGKRVWLVGASSGIGAALAKALLGKGAWVAVSARRADALLAVVEGHPKGVVLTMDVRQPQDWTATTTRFAKHGKAWIWWSSVRLTTVP